MIDRQSWEKHTEDLPPGRRVRVNHDCGAGRTLIVEHKDDGYAAFCFRCNEPGFIPHPPMSLSERLAKLEKVRTLEAKVQQRPDLPEPRECDPQQWPDAARLWLYKVGFSNDDIMRLGFYYHEPTNRVVLPVYDGGVPVFWQARSIDGRMPKYLSPAVDRSRIAAKFGYGPVIVLTEDILSAARVARVTEAWSVMGTKLPDGVAIQLAAQAKPIILMLDPDRAGQSGNIKMQCTLQSLGCETRIVVPRRDPKYLTKQETVSCIESCAPWAYASASSVAAP